MKRLFLTFICLIFFAGCSMNTASADKISPPSEFDASFKSEDFSGTISYRNMAKSEISFLSPESLKGLKLIIDNQKCTMKFSGMTYDCNTSKLTQNSFGNTLIEVISDIQNNNETIDASEENGQIKRTTPKYELYQNKADGNITRIVCGEYDIIFTQK